MVKYNKFWTNDSVIISKSIRSDLYNQMYKKVTVKNNYGTLQAWMILSATPTQLIVVEKLWSEYRSLSILL